MVLGHSIFCLRKVAYIYICIYICLLIYVSIYMMSGDVSGLAWFGRGNSASRQYLRTPDHIS